MESPLNACLSFSLLDSYLDSYKGQDNWPSFLLILSPSVQPKPHMESIHWALPLMLC